jgi:hypothetical protein
VILHEVPPLLQDPRSHVSYDVASRLLVAQADTRLALTLMMKDRRVTLQLDSSVIILVCPTIIAFFICFRYLAQGVAECLALINLNCPAYNML